MRILLHITAVFLCFGCTLAQTEDLPQPTPPPSTRKPDRIVLQGDWQKTGHAKLILVSDETSRELSEARLEANFCSDSGATKLSCQTDLLNYESQFSLSLHQRLFRDVESFGRWERQVGNDRVSGGLASPLLGDDSIRFSYSRPLTEEDGVERQTTVSYSTPTVRSTKLVLQALTTSKDQEFKTELLHQKAQGFELSASMKTLKQPEGELWGLFRTPEIEGKLRWKW